MPLAEQYEQEIQHLAQMYGQPKRVVAELKCSPFDPITKIDRIGEVCMVVRRPDGCLITARKVFYPAGCYRLLTGGVAPGEKIATALLRETYEETGLEVAVRKFLAVIDYQFVHSPETRPPSREFYTFAFLLDEIGGTLQPHDESEQLEDFHCIQPQELTEIATNLEKLPKRKQDSLGGEERDWGRFRAVVHRVVLDTL